jgi:hypothetical protein
LTVPQKAHFLRWVASRSRCGLHKYASLPEICAPQLGLFTKLSGYLLFTASSKIKETIMPSPPSDQQVKKDELRCPECRAVLKKRKTRQPDECEMVCGGCGQTFDVCDLETVEKLKE